jgi:hypothetical protein
MRGFLGITPPRDETYRWDPRRAHLWPEPRRLVYIGIYWCIGVMGSSVRGQLCVCPTSHRKKKLREPYNSPIWGAVTPRLIIMNFDLLGGPTDAMNCSNFCTDRLRVFVLWGAENRHFLHLATAVHNTVWSGNVPTRDKTEWSLFHKGVPNISLLQWKSH